MKYQIAAAIGLAASLLVAPAGADELDGAFVREHANEMLEGALTQEQADSLGLIAYQVAAAAACEGVALDPAKFETVFARLTPVDAEKMNDAQKAYFDQHLLVIYGVMVGGALATFSDDTAAKCETARKAKDDPGLADDLVWQ